MNAVAKKLFARLAGLSPYEKATLLLCGCMLGTLLLVSAHHEIGGYGVETDFYGSYGVEAFNLLQGERYEEPDHGPGYSLMLIPFYWLLRDMFEAGKLLTILSTVLTGFFTFKILQRLFNEKLAFFTVGLFFVAIFPYGFLAGNDLVFALLTSLTIYFFYREGELSLKNTLLCGLVAGFAFMTRMNAVVFPAAVFSTVLLINPERWTLKRRFRVLGWFTAVFVITASPWLIMNTLNRGNPLATEVYQTIGVGMNGDDEINWAEEKHAVAQQHQSLTSVLLGNPVHTAKYFLGNGINHFRRVLNGLVNFPAYLFLVPGGILMISLADRRQLSLLTFPLFGFLVYCLLSFIDRFFLYILPFFFFMVVYFLVQTRWVPDGAPRRTLAVVNGVAYGAIVLFLTVASVKATRAQLAEDPVELLPVAETLREAGYAGETMVARKPHLAFTSGMDVLYFPQVKTVAELVAYAREHGARLVLYSYIEAELRPELVILRQPEAVGSDLQLVYGQEEPCIYVYEVKPGLD